MRVLNLSDAGLRMPWGHLIKAGGRIAVDRDQMAIVKSDPKTSQWLANGMLGIEDARAPAAPVAAVEEAEGGDEDDSDEAPSRDLDTLRATATARGVKFDRRWSAARLLKAIEAAR